MSNQPLEKIGHICAEEADPSLMKPHGDRSLMARDMELDKRTKLDGSQPELQRQPNKVEDNAAGGTPLIRDVLGSESAKKSQASDEQNRQERFLSPVERLTGLPGGTLRTPKDFQGL